eukprot:8171812-Alexandrium_andersonii.AAC.1
MSASLVGSEMCIRDRLFSERLPRGRPQRDLPRTGLRSGEERGRRAGAVSYTHLTLPTICSV